MREAGIFGGKNALGITDGLGAYKYGDKAGPCSTYKDCGPAAEWNCVDGTCTYVATVAPAGSKYPNAYGCFTANDCQSGYCNTSVPVSGMKGQCQVKGQVNPTIGGGHGPGSFCNDTLPCDDPLWCKDGKCSGDVTDYPCAHVETINYVLGSLGLPQNGAWTQAAQDQLAQVGYAFSEIATGCTGSPPSVPVVGKTTPVPVVTVVPVTSKRVPTASAPIQQASMFSNPIVLVALAAAVLGGVVLLKKKKDQKKLAANRRRRSRHSR